ncbi:glycosyl hydrolase [Aspergillus granulosus]|uniref:Glycosyl hydrolase n=1 Tax=Aspergillus granulosus TaxID=176169 RepID=A0ABR4H772_9EURO
MSTFTNPIIPGFAPDPSLVKVGDWYFLVTSSFHMFPGLPIYVSQDLVFWKQIGNVINRREQLSLALSDTTLSELGNPDDIMLATGGLYAPTIRYHDGTFYVVCTNVIHSNTKDSWQNFIASTSLQGIWSDQWSDPVYFDFKGIDPSIFIDEDNKTYIQGSAAPGPYTKINMFEVDLGTGAKLSAEKTIWGGTGGIYPEGPHLYRQNGWYYLLISEGGTHEGHMLTMARAKDIWGPYEACPHNPVLTAFGTEEYVQCTGHCDVFQDDQQRWWGVCLGIRRGDGQRSAMGRETFLTPAHWDDEWLSLELVKPEVSIMRQTAQDVPRLSSEPGVDYLYIRDAALENYRMGDGSSLWLKATPIDLSHPEQSPTFIGKRQRLLDGKSSVVVPRFTGYRAQTNLKFGLACYKDEHRYIRIFYDFGGKKVVFDMVNNAKKMTQTAFHEVEEATNMGSLALRMEYTENAYRMLYSYQRRSGDSWECLATVDTLHMTDPDFTGPVIGVFAVAEDAIEIQFDDLEID